VIGAIVFIEPDVVQAEALATFDRKLRAAM
jgi:hypothetical protein